jgi:regulator of protease activity HflC (stomatin/prohibitin superfamily)
LVVAAEPAWADDSPEPLAILAAVGFGAIAFGLWGWTIVLFKKGPRALLGQEKMVVNAFDNVVVYRKGSFERILSPGAYWLSTKYRKLVSVDTRPEVFQIAQAAITSDRVPVVLRCVVRVQIKDARAAVECGKDYRGEVFAILQSMVKKIGQTWALKDLYVSQVDFSEKARVLAQQELGVIGIECLSFELLQTEASTELPDFDQRDIGFRPH